MHSFNLLFAEAVDLVLILYARPKAWWVEG